MEPHLWTLADRWNRHCGRKIRHSDRSSAENAALRMSLLERQPFNAYHCECCGAWHVGHRRAVPRNK